MKQLTRSIHEISDSIEPKLRRKRSDFIHIRSYVDQTNTLRTIELQFSFKNSKHRYLRASWTLRKTAGYLERTANIWNT